MTKRRWLAVASLLTAALSSSAQADPAWPRAGLRERVGPPRAPHAMPGVDASRSRRPTTTLGATPRVERRLRVAYGIGRGLVTREDGGFFVLHPTARASRFDAHGKLLYSLKLAGEGASAPVVTAGGSNAFVAAGELWLVDERGRVRSRTALGDADFTTRSILASRDGGVVVASNGSIVKLSAFGDLVWRKASPETVLELLETEDGLWSVTAPGSVYRLDGAGRLNKLGELGSTTHSVTVSENGRVLVARTGNHRLVGFDLGEHRLHASVEDATLDLDGPVLLSKDQLTQAFTSDGLLVRYRADGSEAQRVPIDPGARKAPGLDDALLLSDGRLLVARAGADTAVVSPSGEVSTIAASACPDPVGLYAAGPRSVLLACRSGNMLRIE
ncbi:MAG TPA: hypothetical protein VHP33_31375 [Polyangiaceae bacterium]|nr:hypothetical protein [Polyangiaceae bacterium]